MERMRAVESEHQKLVSELCTGRNKTECAWHASMRESRVSDRFLVNKVQSHALLRRGFGTSVPFIAASKVFLEGRYEQLHWITSLVTPTQSILFHDVFTRTSLSAKSLK